MKKKEHMGNTADRVEYLESRVRQLQEVVESQKALIAHLQRMLFGKKSEKVVMDPAELLPGMQEFFSADAKGKEEQAAPSQVTVSGHERTKAAGQPAAGWNGFPEDLERVEKVIDVPEKEREGLVLIGYDVSERLVRRNAYVVQVIKRAKYAERGDARFGVLTAPAPAVPSCIAADLNRCRYDATVVAHVIAEKLVDHIPFYRQSEMFARMGVEYGRSAMCVHFANVSEALMPLFKAMEGEVMNCGILHADETHVAMLEPGSGKARCTWIWVRRTGLGPPLTVFHFALDRSKATANGLLGDFGGTLIRDGYAAYGDLPAEAAGCWAHCRRKFFEARDSHPEYAASALELVKRLYAHERQARQDADAKGGETALFKTRKRIRRESAPFADRYFTLCRQIAAKEPPASAIAKAAAYSLARETELRRFLSDPRLNIDNNPCENVIRPFCLGRKNWLFVGGENGGTSMALLASFAATCKDNGVDFEKWLADVMFRLDTCPAGEIASLLPHRWKPMAT